MTDSEVLDKENYKQLISVSGGVKSGKSRWAEYLLKDCDNVTYVATLSADIDDIEWNNRIKLHKQRRPASWSLIENFNQPNDLFDKVSQNQSILIDSLGGLVNKHLLLNEYNWLEIQEQYFNYFLSHPCTIIFVIEAVGWGVSPCTKAGNIFRERLGFFSDKLDKLCSPNWLVINGRAININELSMKVP